jgi:predicted nucleotidyltransferase
MAGVHFALVFGSFAAGSETRFSDVDLLVVGDIGEEALMNALVDAEAGIGREVNYILWRADEFMERSMAGNHLLREIVSKPLVMLVGDENEFRRVVAGRYDQAD